MGVNPETKGKYEAVFNYIEENNTIGSTHIFENTTSYDFNDRFNIFNTVNRFNLK